MKHVLFLLALATTTTLTFETAALADNKVPSRLLGYTYDSTGITFQVAYGGCLDQATIEFSKVKEPGVTKVTMLQNEDNCELNAPYGITIKRTYQQMGISADGAYQFTNTATPITIYQSSN